MFFFVPKSAMNKNCNTNTFSCSIILKHILSHAALPVPAPPTNLQVTFINSTSVTISWQAPPPDPTVTVASYRLVVSEDQFGLNDSVASSTTTSYTFTGLEEYNNYTCSVVAVSTYGGVSNETVISFTTSQGGSSCLSLLFVCQKSFVFFPTLALVHDLYNISNFAVKFLCVSISVCIIILIVDK